MIFGRATEEIAACHAADIPVEVVPGITAAQGAASRLGVSLTQRKNARRVHYITGHDVDGRLPADFDWRGLTDPSATTVIYMPAATLHEFATRAVAEGLDPATPAVAVAHATQPDEAIIVSTVAELPDQIAVSELLGPVVVMIGRTFASVAAKDPKEKEMVHPIRNNGYSSATFRGW
jgi:uroporphyrin-III C-methyltransferase/precorrin-2 dehydrogenase/sirohydrochlorin ferrochelatase